MNHHLDNPVWPTLRTTLSHLAIGDNRATRFRPDVNVFAAIPDNPDEDSWEALANLLTPGDVAVLSRTRLDVPDTWQIEHSFTGVQYLAKPGIGRPAEHDGRHDLRVVELTEADAQEVAELAAKTSPGPYLPHTILQGGFIGIREHGGHGRLVSVAGLRCQYAEAAEISTVCTAEDFRGRGYGSLLIRELVHRIEANGQRAFLHTMPTNPARALYEHLGFDLVAEPVVTFLRPQQSAQIGTAPTTKNGLWPSSGTMDSPDPTDLASALEPGA